MKILNHLRFGLVVLTASLFVFTTLTLAVTAQSPNIGDYGLKDTATAAGLPTSSVGPIDIAATIINLLLGVIGVVAVLIIIYGGFTWMTAAGNEEKITKAKKLLAGAVIGLFIILASYALASFTINQIKKATLSDGTNTPQTVVCGQAAGELCMSSSSDCSAVGGVVSNYKTCNEADAKTCCVNVP
ncbi:pilin [Patescibacteria group bacterium]|nr:pilin [Patescibacteria group bacterium]